MALAQREGRTGSVAAGAWRETRPRAALGALHGRFERNEAVTGNVLREISGLRFGEAFGAMVASPPPGPGARGKAALALALGFHCWRTLVRESGLPPNAAVDIVTGPVRSVPA